MTPAEATDPIQAEFHGVRYTIRTTVVEGESLTVEVEQLSEASRWRGDFTAQYIEDISAKTGNYKKFTVFVCMLLSAIRQESESVFVDLLTYSDLETLKSKKGAGQAPLKRTIPPNNKRYLILTYAAEFDRVHYPLPLLFQEPTVGHLQSVVQQLRAQLAQSSPGVAGNGSKAKHLDTLAQLSRLREENSALQNQLHLQQQAADTAPSGTEQHQAHLTESRQEIKLLETENELMQKRAEAAEAELERERSLHRRELRRRAKELADMQKDLAEAQEQVRQLHDQCRDLTRELQTVRRRTPALGPSRPLSSSRPVRQLSQASPARAMSPASTRPHSRTSSWGPSRDGRAASPATSRRSTDSIGSGSRARSAPSPRGRFDPTEYIRQRQERQMLSSNHRFASPRRDLSRSSSRLSSGHGSPAPGASRASSTERQRTSSESVERLSQPKHQQTSSSARRAWGSPARPYNRPISGFSQQTAENRASTTGHNLEGPHSLRQRADSPGRALREVKAKLNQITGRRQEQQAAASLSTTMENVSKEQRAYIATTENVDKQMHPEKPEVLSSASAEIADIDQRLHALQTFLKAAKAGAPSK